MSEVLLRQMAMLKLLPRPPRRIGTGELAARLAEQGFETTKRTIQRDLQALSTFFAIECQADKRPFGWRWKGDAPIFDVPAMDPKTALTLKLSSTFLARLLPRDTYQRLEAHLRHAERVLEGLPDSKLAAWPQKVRVLPAGLPVRTPEVRTELLDVVTRALLEDRAFRCTYQRRDGEVRGYDVNPLALVYREALGVLVCTLNKHDDPMTLPLHRFLSAEPIAAARRVPEGFDLDAFLEGGGAGFLLEREPVRLVALLHQRAVPTVAELPIAADQQLSPHDDARWLLTATVPSNLELRRWLLGLGDAVEVLAPPSIRDKLGAIHAALAARYARPTTEPSPAIGEPHVLEERGYVWGS